MPDLFADLPSRKKRRGGRRKAASHQKLPARASEDTHATQTCAEPEVQFEGFLSGDQQGKACGKHLPADAGAELSWSECDDTLQLKDLPAARSEARGGNELGVLKFEVSCSSAGEIASARSTF